MKEKYLEIGGGDMVRDANAVQMDYYSPDTDVKHDANITPYPFEDNEFDIVYMSHVFEHLNIHRGDNFKRIMREMCRITKPNGLIKIWMPYAASIAATWSNPEHKRPFVYHSFDWGDFSKNGQGGIPGKEKYRHENLWKVKRVHLNFGRFYKAIGIEKLMNLKPDLYEHFFTGFFQARSVEYILEVK